MTILKRHKYVIFLLAAASVILFFKLGDMALTDPDETFYAETAKEMLNADEWVTPIIFGKPQFEKPIFYYWLILLSYKIFGINEFAARFPSVLFGIIGILGVYSLGRLMFSELCGFLSGLVLLTCVEYVAVSRGCVTDIVLTTAILLCLLFFLKGWIKGKNIHYIFSAVFAGIAVLTKGPIGLFIPVVIIGPFILITRDWQGLKKIPFFRCILVFLAVVLPWYVIVTKIHGAAFVGEFFGFQNVVRFLKPEHRIGTSPFFYLPVIIGGFFPWSFFLPLGFWFMTREKEGTSVLKGHKIFLIAWFLSVFLFFSVSRTKLVTYIFPLFPMMAIVVGRLWEQFIIKKKEDSETEKNMYISHYALTFFTVLGAIGLSLFVDHRYPRAVLGTAVTASIFLTGVIISLIMLLKEKRSYSFYSIVLAVILVVMPLTMYILPVIEEFESSKAVSCKVKELAGENEAIGGESDNRRGIAFYTDRPDIEDIHLYDDMRSFFSRKERVWGIAKKKHYEQFKEEFSSSVSSPVFQLGKKVVFTNKPDKLNP
ncbi:MAG: glycosyltransferase family 39 protein [Candidatus Omnitrophota bacterium]